MTLHIHEGDENVLNRFIELIKNAQPPAYVSSVEIIPTQVEDLKSFKMIWLGISLKPC